MGFTDLIGKRVEKARNNKGLSQAELARLAGISNDYMNKIERGKQKNIGTEVIESLAGALDLHPSFLLFGKILEPTIPSPPGEKAGKLDEYEERFVAKIKMVRDKRERKILEDILDNTIKLTKKRGK